MVEQQLIDCPKLEVAIENIAALDPDEYALARRKSFGASDSSIILNVNLYHGMEDLIRTKKSTKITEEEREISKKDAVRKGRDLEPLILQKFKALHQGNPDILKPENMYRIKDFPYLTINFDGVIEESGLLIPVEAKFITTYGDKYYNRAVAFERETGTCELSTKNAVWSDITERIKSKALSVGIPPYYYTQVQQQILGLDAPYGYLVALHDKGWELCIYRVPRDEDVINRLIIDSRRHANKLGWLGDHIG